MKERDKIKKDHSKSLIIHYRLLKIISKIIKIIINTNNNIKKNLIISNNKIITIIITYKIILKIILKIIEYKEI